MVKYVGSKEAKEALKNGSVVEMGKRYYRYKDGKVEYADYVEENPGVKWKESMHGVEEVIREDNKNQWRVLKS